MTQKDLELRENRINWSKYLFEAHCAFANLVLDLMKVTGLSYEDGEKELVEWLGKGVPFQETIDSYMVTGEAPGEVVNEVSLEA